MRTGFILSLWQYVEWDMLLSSLFPWRYSGAVVYPPFPFPSPPRPPSAVHFYCFMSRIWARVCMCVCVGYNGVKTGTQTRHWRICLCYCGSIKLYGSECASVCVWLYSLSWCVMLVVAANLEAPLVAKVWTCSCVCHSVLWRLSGHWQRVCARWVREIVSQCDRKSEREEWDHESERDGETEGEKRHDDRMNASNDGRWWSHWKKKSCCILRAVCLYCTCIPQRAVKARNFLLTRWQRWQVIPGPDKEATVGTERVENSCEKDLSVLAEWCSADLSRESLPYEGQGNPCSNRISNPEALPCQYAACICLKGRAALWFIDQIWWFLGCCCLVLSEGHGN